jgi:hypothetical protein
MNEMQREKDTTCISTYAKDWKVHRITESKVEARNLQAHLSIE